MSFIQSFEKTAEGMNIVENDRADVTSRPLDDSARPVYSGAGKNQLVRGRSRIKRTEGKASASGQVVGQFSEEKQFIPERVSHYKRYENSRSQSGGTPSVYDQF